MEYKCLVVHDDGCDYGASQLSCLSQKLSLYVLRKQRFLDSIPIPMLGLACLSVGTYHFLNILNFVSEASFKFIKKGVLADSHLAVIRYLVEHAHL